MTNEIEQGLHEKLCAYVLGELDGADRAEVERELLRSSELRAEKERLEATIGIVRGALSGSEALTNEARDRIVAAAPAPARPSAFQRVPWMRMAAGIGAVALTWALWDHHANECPPANERASGLADAKTEKRDEEVAALAKKNAALGRLGGLGYAGTDASAVERRLDERVQVVEKLRDEPAASESVAQPELRRVESPSKEEAAERLVLLGQSASENAIGRSVAEGEKAKDAGALAAQSAPATAGSTLSVDRAAGTSGAAGSAGGEVRLGLAQSSVGIPTSGHAGRKAPSGAAGEVAVAGRATNLGHGRADSPATAPMLARQSVLPAGPTTGGPAGPSTPGPGLVSGERLARAGDDRRDNFFAGLRAKEGKAAPTSGLDTAGADFEEDVAELDSVDRDFADDDEGRLAWKQLTPAQQDEWIDRRCKRVLFECRRLPNERPRDMFFRFWGDNPFEVTALDPLSTFSIDVDTASYTLARRYLNEGHVPEKSQVRTEEFVNYFKADVDAPTGNATFAVHTDLTPSRFSSDAARKMLRVVVRAKDVDKNERPPLHLTFVIDVSGSMREQNRLETVKHALRLLVAQLEPRDEIALVSFSTDATLRLPMTPVVDRARIEDAIAPLQPDGSTNSNAGLQLGYAQALAGLDPNAINRVVFLSDGVANVGETDPATISGGVAAIREKGVFLNTIGVGMNNHNDVLLEQLADKGDGVCTYVDSDAEAKKALVDRFTGAFVPVARDVKIQVEFDPQQVMRYRLLGYENRAIADADFRNDAVDAGEIGAGHQVTALYEIEPTGAAGEKPLATVRLRWKEPKTAGNTKRDEASEFAFPVQASSYTAFEAAPLGYRRAAIVAQFAEILRRSIHARGDSLDDLIREAETLRKQMPNDVEFAEFCALLGKSKELVVHTLPACDELCTAIDQIRSNAYLRAQSDLLAKESDAKAIAELEKQNAELEARLRQLIRRRLEAHDGK